MIKLTVTNNKHRVEKLLLFYLARSAIYFACVNFFLFFLNWAKLSQDLLDRFSRTFHQMEGICVNVVNPVHFFQFLKGRCHGNQFCVVADWFARSRSISGSAGPFSQSLHHIVGIELQMINPTLFFRYLEGRCHGNQFSGKNVAKLPTPLHLSLCHSETEWDITTSICSLTA